MASERITTKKQHAAALAEVERLMGRDCRLCSLTNAVVEYEKRKYPMQLPTIADAIQFRLDQLGKNAAWLAKQEGFARSRVSEILNGKREPSKAQMRTLYALGISADVLLQPRARPNR